MIRIERTTLDQLNKHTWEFEFVPSQTRLRVASYTGWTRNTTRQRWSVETHYDAISNRKGRNAVPLPDDVIAEARETFLETLVVGLDVEKEQEPV